MIVAHSLSKSFTKKGSQRTEKIRAISDVSFCAEDAQITGLLGPNGAGKSTTLRILATLLKPDQGYATYDGLDIRTHALDIRRQMGFLPHNAGIYPKLTARENIEYFARLCGVEGPDVRRWIDQLIDMLDMGDFIERRADGFSQGQRTKVALARAMVHKPKTLLLDEPTNGLDVMATRNLRKIIRRLREQGHCIVFSSHIMQEVGALCDRIAIISDGAIVLTDTLAGIQAKTGQQDLEDAFVIAIGESLEDEA